MSNLCYEYLKESALFEAKSLEKGFVKLTDGELLLEVCKYRDFCLDNADNLEAELRSDFSKLKIFSGTDVPRLDLLKQCGLYVEQFLICDPLFPFSEWSNRNNSDIAFDGLIGMKSSSQLSRQKLIDRINYLKELGPMIEAGFVKTFPTTRLFERPKEIPFRYSTTGFSEELPGCLLDFFHSNSIVESIKESNGQMLIDGSLDRGRKIHIRFRDNGIDDARGYILTEQQVVSVDEKSLTVETLNYLPQNIPSEEQFTAWVHQSINQTAGHLYRRVLTENELAAYFGASYICKTPFLFDLLQQVIPCEESVESSTTNALLNFEVPFIQDIDAETLMRIRLTDGEAFHSFRIELERHFRELRLVEDPNELKVRAENAFHEMRQVQVSRIEQKMKQIKKQLFGDAILASAGLIGALQTGGFSLISVAIALLHGHKAYADYLSAKHDNPSFFLWKVLH